MDSAQNTERRRLVIESARKRLAEGTWPHVVAVFGYKNPRAPRTQEDEFACLKDYFVNAHYPAIAEFVDLVRFAESEHGVTMSFNFSMRYHSASEESFEKDTRLLFLCPDILVGTRSGVEGAVVWLKNLSDAIPTMVPETIQVMDKVFGEAVLILKGPSRTVSLVELARSALLGEDGTFQIPQPPEH